MLLVRALELARKAVELDENESMGYYMLGNVHLRLRSFDLAEEYHRRAVEVNPNNPVHVSDMGYALIYLGRLDEAIDWLERAKRVDPFFEPAWYWHTLGIALFAAQRYDEAIRAFERASTRPAWTDAYVGASHACAGRLVQARECMGTALRKRPEMTVTTWAPKEPFKNNADLEHLLDALRQAGLPE